MKNNSEDNSDQTSATSSRGVSYDPMEATPTQHDDAINMRDAVFPEQVQHMELEHGQPTELMRLTAKSKEGLRKGKWTPEEELYTNKVIEVFNAGLLKLGDNERGITLRAYLAEKLNCDPMRITKKYTGASCLGKRVFHFDYQHADHAEAERARQELQILENNFRMKLEVMSKKRMCDPRSNADGAYSVTTPAIDALLHRNNNSSSMMMPMLFPPTMSMHGFDGSAAGAPAFFAAAAAAAQFQQQQAPARPHFIPVSSGLYTQILAEVSKGSSDITLMGPKEAPFLRGPNDEIFLPPPGFGPLHFMPPPTHARSTQLYPYFAPSLSMMAAAAAKHLHDPVQVPIASAADLRQPLFPSMGKVPSWKDLATLTNNTALNLPMPISHLSVTGNNSSGNNGDEHKDKRPRVIKSRSNPKLLAEFGSQENLFNAASLEEDAILNKQIENAESDQNEAATSLLGFINHVRRNSSQEDLLEFFEGVQKTITSSPQGAVRKSTSSTGLNNNSSSSSNPPRGEGSGGSTGKISVK